MVKNLMTNGSYKARAPGLLNSAVVISLPGRFIPGNIPYDTILQPHIL